MTEQAKAEQLSPGCDTSCYPLRKWWQPAELGLEPVLELGNLPQRRWPSGCSPWLGGYQAPSPLVVPGCVVGTAQTSSPCNASTEQYKWRVILDMTHFAPSEISVSVREGFLVVGGSHSERPDVFGFTARCFTRKYRLPVGIDVSKLTSAMSGDGILCVEAPLPDTYSIPADIIIPVQVEKETIGGHETQEDHKEAETETHAENGEPQRSEPTRVPEPQPPTEPEQPSTEAPDHGEEEVSPLAGDDNKQEEEEVNGTTPSGGEPPHPLAPADEEGTERSFPEPSEHSDALDSRDNTASSSMEQQTEEEILETDAESRETQPTAPVPSDQQAAAEDHGEEADHPGSVAAAAGDLQEHEEGTEKKDAETHAEPTAEPHPAPTPAASDDGTAESLPDPPPPPPPELREVLDGQDSPAAGTAGTASAEPAHDGEIQPEKEEATEEITQQHEEDPELVKGLPSDGLSSQELLDLAASDVKQ